MKIRGLLLKDIFELWAQCRVQLVLTGVYLLLPLFTSVGMTDECCATVYGYASGQISREGLEDTEDLEVVLADREEVRRILKEERVAIMCAYMLMHFLKEEEPFGFLQL